MKAIREHHGIDPDTCFRCGRNGQMFRGHVIAHSAGGGGGVDNLVPLCNRCNRLCIPWGLGDEKIAWAWMGMNSAQYCLELWRNDLLLSVDRWVAGDPTEIAEPRRFVVDKLQLLAEASWNKTLMWTEENRTGVRGDG